MALVVRNTFLDLVDQAAETPICGSTKRSSSVPKNCKFQINKEDPFSILADESTIASDATPNVLSDADFVDSSEDEMQSCVSAAEEVSAASMSDNDVEAPSQTALLSEAEVPSADVQQPKIEDKRPSWLDWSPVQLPVDRRAGRQSKKDWGSSVARLNALDLSSCKKSVKACSKVVSAKNAKHVAEDAVSEAPTRAGSSKFEEFSEGCTENFSEVCTVEPVEARFQDEFDDDLESKAKLPIQLCVLMPEDVAGAPPAETKLKASAASFMPASCGIGEAAMVIAAAQMALSASPEVVNVERCDGTLGTITMLSAQVRDRGQLAASAGKSALQAAKAALLSGASLSQNVYVIGYLTEAPFEDFEDGSGFAASLGFVTPAQQDTACWDTFQKGFCPRPSTCRWCHPSESDLVRVHVSIQ